jgi:hypothetical protein
MALTPYAFCCHAGLGPASSDFRLSLYLLGCQ